MLLATLKVIIQHYDFFCVGVTYSGEYDACDVTLSIYPHRAMLEKYAWPEGVDGVYRESRCTQFRLPSVVKTLKI
jgi:hypothetical protein